MSFSIDVRLPESVDIFVNRLVEETSRVARILLCQEEDFKFDLVFTIGNTPVSVISLYDRIYGFEEHRYLGEGAYLLYSFDEYSEQYDQRKMYNFSVEEIPWEKQTLKPFLCITLAVAFAKLTSQPCLLEYSGFLSLNEDDVSVEELMKLANPHFLPLDEALSAFYKKLPLGQPA